MRSAVPAVTRCLTPPLQATLWWCEQCKAFIAIHCGRPVAEPFCPICGATTPIELRGPLPSVLGLQFAEA
jgi:ABC-type ATPase with predicted acetyltransferase domain